MKRLNTSPITGSNQFPVKSGTLDFLQDAHKETTLAVVTSLLGFVPVNGVIYKLNGCVNSATLPAHDISAGVLFLNGEIFDFDGATFTLTGLNKAYARIETTQYTSSADPVQFTDGISRNVHNIRKIVVEATTVSSSLPEFKDFVNGGAWIQGDTKEVVCDSTYLTANFDGTGLGKNERTGWAIMNGNNGTQDDSGLVVVAYGTGYTTLEATGGSADAVVVEHTHRIARNTGNFSSTGGAAPVSFGSPYTNDSEPAGVSGVGKNMQPYVVRLRIQKI